MKKVLSALMVTIGVGAWSGSLAAHHSLARFDTTTPVWVKGTVVRFERVNPHSRIFVDAREHGTVQQWVVDGPGPNALARMGLGDDFLKAGDVIEVCGFGLKEDAASEDAPKPTATPSVPGRLLNGHLVKTPDGRRRFWSDYGQFEKCLNPGEKTETFRQEAFGR
jgi:hypothetical protein